MLTSFSTQPTRLRATALGLAFGIIAGGAALVGAPAYAATDAPATPAADATATAEAAAAAAPAAAEAAPVVDTEKDVYTMDEFMAGSVSYLASGFTPGVELEIAIVDPTGEVNAVDLATPIIVTADGLYSGKLEPVGEWAEGEYQIVLATKDKTLPNQQSATVAFTVGAPAPTSTPTTPARTPQGAITNPIGDGRLTAYQAKNDGVQYLVTGFLPGAQLVVSGTDADGEPFVFDTNEVLTADGDGNAVGVLTGTDWPVGFYTITVTDPATGDSVTMEFEIYQHPAGEGGPNEPVPTAQPVGAPTQAPQLAETGAEAFGPAGLALATLVAGAGVLVASRRLAK